MMGIIIAGEEKTFWQGMAGQGVGKSVGEGALQGGFQLSNNTR
jgi:hypothetical protein